MNVQSKCPFIYFNCYKLLLECISLPMKMMLLIQLTLTSFLLFLLHMEEHDLKYHLYKKILFKLLNVTWIIDYDNSPAICLHLSFFWIFFSIEIQKFKLCISFVMPYLCVKEVLL